MCTLHCTAQFDQYYCQSLSTVFCAGWSITVHCALLTVHRLVINQLRIGPTSVHCAMCFADCAVFSHKAAAHCHQCIPRFPPPPICIEPCSISLHSQFCDCLNGVSSCGYSCWQPHYITGPRSVAKSPFEDVQNTAQDPNPNSPIVYPHVFICIANAKSLI